MSPTKCHQCFFVSVFNVAVADVFLVSASVNRPLQQLTWQIRGKSKWKTCSWSLSIGLYSLGPSREFFYAFTVCGCDIMRVWQRTQALNTYTYSLNSSRCAHATVRRCRQPTSPTHTACPHKSKPKCSFAITLTTVHKFPPNVARSFSNECWTMWVKADHFTRHVCTHSSYAFIANAMCHIWRKLVNNF